MVAWPAGAAEGVRHSWILKYLFFLKPAGSADVFDVWCGKWGGGRSDSQILGQDTGRFHQLMGERLWRGQPGCKMAFLDSLTLRCALNIPMGVLSRQLNTWVWSLRQSSALEIEIWGVSAYWCPETGWDHQRTKWRRRRKRNRAESRVPPALIGL